MKGMKMIRSMILGFVFPLIGSAAEIPLPVIPEGVGVNIHFVTGHEQDLDLIAAAGFKFIRMDFAWEAIEKQKGKYDWSEYDQLVANLDERGIRALFILDYSHHLHEEAVTSPHPITGATHRTTASPQHPESIAAFARWSAGSAKHFHGRHIIWEIWNEPNGHFWAPKPDAQQYSALAIAAAKAIRDTEPQATIVGPASSGFPWEYLETFLKSGVLEYLDGVSVHPYRNPKQSPETASADYKKLRDLIARYAPAGKTNMPILSGEWGYSTHAKGVSLETQADFAARQQLSNLLNGVPLSIWYDWKNDGEDPAENEHNFGTVMPDLKRKPAYLAIQKLTR
jgi:polysaccharide biosynthesis protein PslG